MEAQPKRTLNLPRIAVILIVVASSVLCDEGGSTVQFCQAGKFPVKPKNAEARCIDCNTCPPGTGSSHDCDFSQVAVPESKLGSIRCLPCENGTYQDSTSYKQCKPCTHCPPGMVIVQNCTVTINSVCGCGPGQRLDGSGNCKAKSPLTTKLPQTKEPLPSSLIYTTSVYPTEAVETQKTTETIHTDSAMSGKTIAIIAACSVTIIVVIVVALVFWYNRKEHQKAIRKARHNYTRLENGKIASNRTPPADDLGGIPNEMSIMSPADDPGGIPNDRAREIVQVLPLMQESHHEYADADRCKDWCKELEKKRIDKARESIKALPLMQAKSIMRTIYGDCPFSPDKRIMEILSERFKKDDIKKIWTDWLVPVKNDLDISVPPQTVQELFPLCRTLVPKWTMEKFLNILIEIGRSDIAEAVCTEQQKNYHKDHHIETQV